jgi:hypothetical protein
MNLNRRTKGNPSLNKVENDRKRLILPTMDAIAMYISHVIRSGRNLVADEKVAPKPNRSPSIFLPTSTLPQQKFETAPAADNAGSDRCSSI